MKILIIPSWYKSKDNPVLGNFFEDQARSLLASGFDVCILYPYFTRLDDSFLVVVDEGLYTYYVPIKISKRPLISQLSQFVKKHRNYIDTSILSYADKVFSSFGRPDILHAHSTYLGGIAAMAFKKEFDINYVITEHASFISKPSIYYFGSKNPWRIIKTKWIQVLINRQLIESVYNKSKGLILVSEIQKQEINKHYAIKVPQYVIGNVVNPLFFNKTKDKPTEKYIILSIGNFIRIKNFEFLIRAFSKILPHYPNAELHLIGQGPLKEKYSTMNVDNVIIKGSMNRHEVRDAMSSASLVVSTSHFETFGVSIAEAMALGKSVIVPVQSPLAYLVKDDMATYKNNNLRDLIEKLSFHIIQGNSFNEVNKEIAIKKFSPEVIASKLKALYTANA